MLISSVSPAMISFATSFGNIKEEEEGSYNNRQCYLHFYSHILYVYFYLNFQIFDNNGKYV